jgi:hypothetical protein
MKNVDTLQMEIDYLIKDKENLISRLAKTTKDDVKLFLQNLLNNTEENISALEEKKSEILSKNT